MHINLQQVKTIDVHCHPFSANEKLFTEVDFLEHLSLAVVPNMFKKKKSSEYLYPGMNMYMQITIQKLAEYFNCEPTVEQVVTKRNEYAKDFSGYTKNLFHNVSLKGLLVDYGYPTPPIDRNEFEKLVGFSTMEVYRIEPAMDRLREECKTFQQFIDEYRADLRSSLNNKHVLGLKSIIAYRSGLDIGKMDIDIASKQYEDFRMDRRAKVKSLKDYCLHVAMEECTRSDKVMHIHTGVGDGEVILQKASPSLLIDMLREEKYANTKVHFVHGGYPWMEEAAFITSILPNVYMDISLQNPFSGHGVKRIISQVFEFAPFNKVMYGSDAFTVPEMNWLGVGLFKECFEEVLLEWIDQKYMDEKTAQTIGEMVLYKNFETVYNKDING
ncbi:amidohydrolase family protein [Virgibacillus sp. W0181]|uniref:amidohydrolase family protein n=1 Tax=Virgibacillus sp. W0181 TaxID=3391581 RepID=UPI003F446230